MTTIEKFREIAKIESEYYTECMGETLTLEDQLCMIEIESDNDPWKEIQLEEIHEKIAECMARIQAVLLS